MSPKMPLQHHITRKEGCWSLLSPPKAMAISHYLGYFGLCGSNPSHMSPVQIVSWTRETGKRKMGNDTPIAGFGEVRWTKMVLAIRFGETTFLCPSLVTQQFQQSRTVYKFFIRSFFQPSTNSLTNQAQKQMPTITFTQKIRRQEHKRIRIITFYEKYFKDKGKNKLLPKILKRQVHKRTSIINFYPIFLKGSCPHLQNNVLDTTVLYLVCDLKVL